MIQYNILSSQLTGRCYNSRKIGNNTWLERRGDNIAVRLYATDVVTFTPAGDII